MAFIYILTLCLVVFLFRNRHKFILFYSVFSIVLQPWVCLRFEPPALTVSFIINFMLCFFCWKKRKTYLSYHPLSLVIMLSIVGIVIGVFSSITDIVASLPAAISSISSFAIVYMVYHEIKNQQDMDIILKSFVVVCVLLLGYGFYEYLLQDNPVFNEVLTWSSRDLIYGKLFYRGLLLYDADTTRFGSERCSSLMSIYISWGALCVIFIGFMMFCRDKLIIFIKPFCWWGLFLMSIFCLYTAGSRSPYVYFAIVAVPFFIRDFKVKTKLFGISLLVIGLFIFQEQVMDIVYSIKHADKFGGSSVDMRLMQLNAIRSVLSENLIFGLGLKGGELASSMNPEILGAESIWFHTLISGGLVGAFLLVCVYICMFKKFVAFSSPKTRLSAACFVLGWITFSSLTSFPGLTISYIFTIMTIIIRYWQLQREEE